jgi:DNA-binding transcriptional regulator YiaG
MGTQFADSIKAFRDKDFRVIKVFTGADIRIARRALNLTQEQLADRLVVAVRAIEKWEHNLHCPTPSLHKEIYKLLRDGQENLRSNKVPPGQMTNAIWHPPNCKPYKLVCKFKNGFDA